MKHRFKLSTRIAFGFGCLIALACAIGAATYIGASKARDSLGVLVEERLPSENALRTLQLAVDRVKSTQRTLLMPDLAPDVLKRQYGFFSQAYGESDEAIKTYDALPHSAQELKTWGELKAVWSEWRSTNDAFMESIKKARRPLDSQSRQASRGLPEVPRRSPGPHGGRRRTHRG